MGPCAGLGVLNGRWYGGSRRTPRARTATRCLLLSEGVPLLIHHRRLASHAPPLIVGRPARHAGIGRGPAASCSPLSARGCSRASLSRHPEGSGIATSLSTDRCSPNQNLDSQSARGLSAAELGSRWRIFALAWTFGATHGSTSNPDRLHTVFPPRRDIASLDNVAFSDEDSRRIDTSCRSTAASTCGPGPRDCRG